MKIKPTTRRAALANRKPQRYLAMCVPGRNDADPGAWFVYDRESMRSHAAPNRGEAQRRARKLNEAANN